MERGDCLVHLKSMTKTRKVNRFQQNHRDSIKGLEGCGILYPCITSPRYEVTPRNP